MALELLEPATKLDILAAVADLPSTSWLEPLFNISGVVLGGLITYRVTRHFEQRAELKREKDQTIHQYMILIGAYNRLLQTNKAVVAQMELSKSMGADGPVWQHIPEVVNFEEQPVLVENPPISLFVRFGRYDVIIKIQEAVESYNTAIVAFRKLAELKRQLEGEAKHEKNSSGLFTTTFDISKSGPKLQKLAALGPGFLDTLRHAIGDLDRALKLIATEANSLRKDIAVPKFGIRSVTGDAKTEPAV